MSFYNVHFLYWLWILLFLILIYILQLNIRKKKIKKWLGPQNKFLRSSISEQKRSLKTILKLCTLFLLFIAIARPQGLGEKMEMQNKGVYILLLIDASNSMLAEDIKPNRLSFMKKEISRLINLSPKDQFALGVFAHSAFLATPFTKDLSAVKSYLEDLSTDHLTNQGTNFERAFQLGDKVFEKIKEDKNEQSVKVIIVASDGEDHSKKTKTTIKNLVLEKDIRVFTLSFGTRAGGVIPIKDYKGQVKEYKKDMHGNVVVTQLKEKSLQNFAQWGKGSYYHVNYGGTAIHRLRQDLNRLEKTLLEKASYIKKKELYQWFLVLAFFLAFIELILTDRSYKNLLSKKQS